MVAMLSCTKSDTTTPASAVSTDARDKFVGNWVIHDTDYQARKSSEYIMTIAKSLTIDGGLQIFNYINLASEVTATVAKDSFFIPSQIIIYNGNSIHMSGFGACICGTSLSFGFAEDPFGFGQATGIKR